MTPTTPEEKPDSRLEAYFDAIKELPARSKERAASGRAAFLAEAGEISGTGVSPAAERRHTAWIHNLKSWWVHQKETRPMFNIIATTALVLTLIFGGGGITAAAAQASLPDELLYPVKILSEDVRYGMASEQTRLELELQYAEKRMTEIQQMTQAGQVPAEATLLRLQTQLRTALQSASGLENDAALRQLEQIHTRLQNQLAVMDSAGPAAEPLAEAARLQSRQMIQEHLALCEAGLTDPAMLRQQLRDRTRLTNQQTKTDVSSAESNPSETAEGASNPWTTGTPIPGSSYGPGGQNPWTTGTPTPGSSYGPGTGTCAPECLQNGTGDGTCTNCPQDGMGPQNGGPNDGDGKSGGGKP